MASGEPMEVPMEVDAVRAEVVRVEGRHVDIKIVLRHRGEDMYFHLHEMLEAGDALTVTLPEEVSFPVEMRFT